MEVGGWTSHSGKNWRIVPKLSYSSTDILEPCTMCILLEYVHKSCLSL